MKKVVSILLLLLMCISLFGCSKLAELDLPPLPDVQSIKEEQAETEAEVAPPVETLLPLPTTKPLAEEHVIVNISSHSETFMDPQHGTEPILIFSYETPVVYVEGRDQATELINEHIAHLNETYQTGNDYGFGTSDGVNLLLEMATDNYSYIVNSGGEGMNMLFTSDRSVKTVRADRKVLSLVFNTNVYTGGAHGNYIDRAYIFDTVNGERVTFDMLSPDSEALRAFILDYMLKLYAEDAEQYYSQRVMEDMLMDMSLEEAFKALLREGSWYLGQDGFVVFSDIYELGPYSAGITEFTVPYTELSTYIDAKWLPDAKSGEGSFSIMPQSAVEEGTAQIIDRVVVNEEGEQLCLVANGIVYDIRLSKVTYHDKFYETAQLWACSYMEDCLLQLDVTVPEGIPDLMLRYTDGTGMEHSLLISRSGEDGSYILTDDDIQAVG